MCLDDHCDGSGLNRRAFLAAGAGSVAALAASLTDALAQQQGQPPTRVLDAPGIQHGKEVFPHGSITIDGFLARPKAEGRYPVVLVIAGNRITEEYIPNTCAALAVAGFVGFAPNIFHPLPDSPRTREEMQRALANRTDPQILDEIESARGYLQSRSFVAADEIAILGFCFGGRLALLYSAGGHRIKAVVPFHPGVVTAPEIASLTAPVQIHHGTADRAVDVANSLKVKEILEAQRTPVEVFTYEGADHGFLAYTRPFYRPDDAKLAWTRVVSFLERHLRS